MAYQSESKSITEKKTAEGYFLAPLLLRVTAATLDLAIYILVTLVAFFAFYRPVANAAGVNSANETLSSYRARAGLMKEEDGKYSEINSDKYEDYKTAVEYYYLTWNSPSVTDNPETLGYTVDTYNVKILGLPVDDTHENNSEYFRFQKDDLGNDDRTKIGVIREEFYMDNNPSYALTHDAQIGVLSFYQSAFEEAYRHQSSTSYYKAIETPMKEKTLLLLLPTTIVPALLVYLLPSMIGHRAQTLGKRLMKIRLVSIDGYDVKWWWRLLRIVPFIICIVAFLLLDDLVVAGSICGLIFFFSFGLAMFTKKRQALHDYLALTVTARNEEENA